MSTITGPLGSHATRDMSHLRKKDAVTEMIAKGRAQLTDLSGNHKIELDWELNQDAVKDKIFALTIDDKKVYIDLEEFVFVQRIMFMKK